MTTTSTSASRSNLGPLTTTFSPPPACFVFANDDSTGATEPSRFVLGRGCDADKPDRIRDETTCWPPTTVTTTPENPFGSWGFYSPGIVCPAGYTSACQARWTPRGTSSGSSTLDVTNLPSFLFDYAAKSGESIVGCCPIGFQCSLPAFPVQTCIKLVDYTTITTGHCGTGAGALSSLGSTNLGPRHTITRNGTVRTDFFTYNTLEAPLIQLMYQPTDVARLTTETSPLATSSTAAASAASATPLAIALPIAIVGTALLVGVGAIFWRRHRRRLRTAPHVTPVSQPAQEPSEETHLKSELPGGSLSGLRSAEPSRPVVGPELDGTARAELDRSAGTHELAGGEVAQELWIAA